MTNLKMLEIYDHDYIYIPYFYYEDDSFLMTETDTNNMEQGDER